METLKNNQFFNISEEIRNKENFCLWTMNGDSKIPLAKTNDKSTFKPFNQIVDKVKEGQGIGIGMFDSLCGIDIDHCIDESGKISATALDIINTIDSYTEKSPSGTGVHILFNCNNQEKINNEEYYTKNSNIGLEIYQGNYDNRYFTITGNKIQGDMKVIDFESVKKVLNKYNKKPKKEIQIQKEYKPSENNKQDREYLEEGLKKDSKLQELWNSTPSGSGGNESETDQSIMNKLAYWSNANESLMKEYFEQSPYFQKKDTQHQKKWNRQDYQRSTIQNAIRNLSSTARQDNQRFNEELAEKRLEQLKKKIDIVEVEETEEDILQMLKSKSVKNNIQSFFEKSEKGNFIPIPSGFTNLDKVLNGGFQKQSLVVIGGGSSMGKTTFSINLAMNFIKQNKKVIYYSLEMSEEQIQAKVFSNITYKTEGKQISSDRLFKLYDHNTMTEERKKILYNNIQAQEELNNLFIIHESNLLDDIQRKVESINQNLVKTEKQSPILIIDYLQYLQGRNKEDTQSLIKRATAFFKKYAIENETLVICLTANNRTSTEERKKTSFSSGRDSSDIEYSSDYNLQINFAEWEYYTGNNPSELHSLQELKEMNPKQISLTLHKARMGESGKMTKYKFNGITNNFESISDEESETNYNTKWNTSKRI